MSITVNTNMQALRIQQNLSGATSKMNTAMERMSSGYKINSSKDDAAGLAVSTGLETTISSSKIASDNVQIGSNLLDTSEGTLDTILSNLQRVRDLVEQASTGTYSSTDKAALATEVEQRLAQIDSSAQGTSFNGISLFGDTENSTNGIDLQVGTDSTTSSTLNLDKSLFKGAQASQLGMMKVNWSGEVGNSSITSIQLVDPNGAATDEFVCSDDAGTLITSVKGAIDAVMGGTAFTKATAGAGAATAYDTNKFLDRVDAAIDNVTSRITKIGAYQNRLESVSDSLDVQQTNLTAANSTIRDADVAEESAAYVQSQILQSASATLLTQANSAPQIALTLIQG